MKKYFPESMVNISISITHAYAKAVFAPEKHTKDFNLHLFVYGMIDSIFTY